MSLAIYVLWFAVGICPDWWPPFRWPPPPPWPPEPGPGPYPPPWRFIVSGLAGVLGGWLFSNTWGPEQGGVDAFYAGITCLGAVVASILVRGLVDTFMQGRGQIAK